jgi:hypothetical protein
MSRGTSVQTPKDADCNVIVMVAALLDPVFWVLLSLFLIGYMRIA